ncbi:MAG: hypothetical protein HPY50_14050 [Firmicutes bacterium]|nr:hypothetical protein [Bacillota bacterium]
MIRRTITLLTYIFSIYLLFFALYWINLSPTIKPEVKAEETSSFVEKGAEAVKRFTGKADIELTYFRIQSFPSGKVVYFKSADSIYLVHESGKVVGVHSTEQTWKGELVLNESEAFNLAKKYAEGIYENFDSRNMKMLERGLKDRGSFKEYDYLWREEVDGISTPNYVSVRVNPYTGRISDYRCQDVGILTIPAAKIDRGQAIELLKKRNPKISNVNAELDVWLTKDSQPLLRWTVRADLPLDGEIHRGVGIVINAVTGEIIEEFAF